MFVKCRGRRYEYNERVNPQSIVVSLGVKSRVIRCLNTYEDSPRVRVSDRLFSEAKDVGMQVIGHNFHAEMVQGALCSKRFQRFIVQDIFYLEGCIGAFESAKIRFPEHFELFDLLINDTVIGLNKYKRYRASLEINENLVKMNKACREYIAFLTNVAQKGELVAIIGALWPCYSVFLEIYHVYVKEEMKLLTYKHPYYEFVKKYKELSILPSAEEMKRIMDDILIKANEEEQERLKEIFFHCFDNSLKYEKQFFDAFYEIDNLSSE